MVRRREQRLLEGFTPRQRSGLHSDQAPEPQHDAEPPLLDSFGIPLCVPFGFVFGVPFVPRFRAARTAALIWRTFVDGAQHTRLYLIFHMITHIVTAQSRENLL